MVADEPLVRTFQERVSSWFSDSTEVRVTVTSSVDEQRLLDTSPTEVRAWIVPLSQEHALLTFSSVIPPAAPRHLVREVRLQAGLDELGLERLASVTHSAFVALSEGVEGVAREQAERELSAVGVAPQSLAAPDEPAALAPRPPPAPPPPPPSPPAPAAIPQPVRAALPPPLARSLIGPLEPAACLLLAAGYGLRWRGAEGLAHGPSLSLGVQLWRAETAIDLQLSGQYLFRSAFEAKPFTASVQTTALRAQFGVERRLRGALFGQALLGFGADLARVSASAVSANSGSASLLPNANGTQWRGAGELTFGILHRGEALDVGIYAQANLALEDVRYSARTGGAETPLVRPWLVQPALSIQGRFRSAL